MNTLHHRKEFTASLTRCLVSNLSLTLSCWCGCLAGKHLCGPSVLIDCCQSCISSTVCMSICGERVRGRILFIEDYLIFGFLLCNQSLSHSSVFSLLSTTTNVSRVYIDQRPFYVIHLSIMNRRRHLLSVLPRTSSLLSQSCSNGGEEV